MVGLFVANTDNEWFDFLAAENDLTEVNFWQPSARAFHAVQPGELFAFRLKSPRDKIGGFGVLSSGSVLPLQMVWETFGRSNGTASYLDLQNAISAYRPGEDVRLTTNIGCRILVEPVFLPEELWLELPPTWSKNIMGGKRFSTDESDGFALWNKLQEAAQISSAEVTFGFQELGPRFGNPTLISPRLGQGAFRIAVTEAYGRQCALSDGKVLPALDAAHIRPYAEGGVHAKSNGILLRRDIHSVFDSGYATVDADYRFVVSSKVKEVFDNGNEYRRLHGKSLRLPLITADRPDLQHLRWHNENRFVG